MKENCYSKLNIVHLGKWRGVLFGLKHFDVDFSINIIT